MNGLFQLIRMEEFTQYKWANQIDRKLIKFYNIIAISRDFYRDP